MRLALTLSWTKKAAADLVRLHEFLAPLDERAADAVVQSLVRAASKLPPLPRIGERLGRYEPREVRRLVVGSYELRYEVTGNAIFVLRVWHVRERR